MLNKLCYQILLMFFARLCFSQSAYYVKAEVGILSNQSHQNDFQGNNNRVGYSNPSLSGALLVGRRFHHLGVEVGLTYSKLTLGHTVTTHFNYSITSTSTIDYKTVGFPCLVLVPIVKKGKSGKIFSIDVFGGGTVNYLVGKQSGFVRIQKAGSGRYSNNGSSADIAYSVSIDANVFTPNDFNFAILAGSNLTCGISEHFEVYAKICFSLGLNTIAQSVSKFQIVYHNKDRSFMYTETGYNLSTSLKGDYVGLNLGCKFNF